MEPLSPKDPKTVGDYTLIGRLGSGGMGVVYIAANGPETVALKVVRESLLDDPAQATRFAREIETLQKVNSPYVARIFDSGVSDERAWYATEFVNGPDLKSLVEAKGALKQEHWAQLAAGLASGLAAIHAQGIIHRDIKPANIIMAESGPKIIDFGIAQISDATSVTSTGLVAGSPAWFSPEQIEGKPLTTATDLFSAGSVLTYAATGRSPWGDDSTMTKASVYGILVSEPNLRGASPEQLKVISSLLRKEARDRSFPSMLSIPVEQDSDLLAREQRDGADTAQIAPRQQSFFAQRGALVALTLLALSLVFASILALVPTTVETTNQSENPGTGSESAFAANTSCAELDTEFTKVVQTAQQATRETRLSSWGAVKDDVIMAISDYEKFLLEVPSNRLPADFVSDSLSFSEQYKVRLYSMDESSSYSIPTEEPAYSRWNQHVKSVFEEGDFCG